MTARWATEADAGTISAWWNTAEVQVAVYAAGYEVSTLSQAFWAEQLHRTDQRFALGFVTTTLRAIIGCGQGAKSVGIGVWAVDPRITLALRRSNMLDCIRLIATRFDPSWSLEIPFVPPSAVRLREALDTRMTFVDGASTATREDTGRTYTLALGTLRTRV